MLTTVLAVVGAATGLTGTILSVLNYRRDRAIIRLRSQTLVGSGGGSSLIIEVRNEGRHGVTLTGLGLLVVEAGAALARGPLERAPAFGNRRRISRMRRDGVFYSDLNYLVDDTSDADFEPFLEPGHQLAVTIPMTEANGRASGGREAWPCATDYTGESFLGEHRALP